MSITIKVPMESVMQAIHEFYRLNDEASKNAKPPINIPSKKPVEPDTSCDVAKPVRPSVRQNQPNLPPTQQEIRKFLERLRKTPFKRGSKGFNAWMKDFGADPETPTDQT